MLARDTHRCKRFEIYSNLSQVENANGDVQHYKRTKTRNCDQNKNKTKKIKCKKIA